MHSSRNLAKLTSLFLIEFCATVILLSHYQWPPLTLSSCAAFGKIHYKGKQKEIVEAAIQGADIFVSAPTGMGKVRHSLSSSTRLPYQLFRQRAFVFKSQQ